MNASQQTSSSANNSFEEIYEQADLFLDSVDFNIVMPEPTRKTLTIRQDTNESLPARTLSAPAKIENTFDLKSVKESPLMLRRKLAVSTKITIVA